MPANPPLILGAHSVVGWSVYQAAVAQGAAATPVCGRLSRAARCKSWHKVNLEERGESARLIDALAPSLVIYAGGVCNVKQCQEGPEFARRVNVDGVSALLAALPSQTRLIFCSSDHVFGGVSGPCDEETLPRAISVYGQTRIDAEALLRGRANTLVVRTALGIGPSVDGKTGHLDWLATRSTRGRPISIIEGEARSAVWGTALGARVWALAHSDLVGVRHVSATRVVDRVSLARFLGRKYGFDLQFDTRRREDLSYPHLGRVELATRYRDALASPLASVMDEQE